MVAIPSGARETRVQPVAGRDAIRYLVAVFGEPAARNRVLEIGGPDVVSYADLLQEMAERLGGRRVQLPLIALPDALTKLGVSLLTDVDPQTALVLLESLGNDVVVTNRSIADLFPGPALNLGEMLDAALADPVAAKP